MVRPLWRMEMTSEPKSWTAPMTMDPMRIQRRAGSQPQTTATAGPTIGPVPAIEVKWWPKTMARREGTKSTPSSSSTEGARRSGSIWKMRLARYRP